jgi:hypothetical protein
MGSDMETRGIEGEIREAVKRKDARGRGLVIRGPKAEKSETAKRVRMPGRGRPADKPPERAETIGKPGGIQSGEVDGFGHGRKMEAVRLLVY